MKDSCSSLSGLLEKYHDQEVTDRERLLVEGHLSECSACRNLLSGMVELGNLLKIPVREAAEKEDFHWVWQKVKREIRERDRSTWRESLRSWLDVSPLLRKRVWVPALAATLVILSLIAVPVVMRENTSLVKLSPVEYVESQDYNVMIYEGEKGNVTVIWLFDGPDEEVPIS